MLFYSTIISSFIFYLITINIIKKIYNNQNYNLDAICGAILFSFIILSILTNILNI